LINNEQRFAPRTLLIANKRQFSVADKKHLAINSDFYHFMGIIDFLESLFLHKTPTGSLKNEELWT